MKIPFKVSARTARLIGRENVASAKGAIIELVKNGYDADSECGLIYIDNRYYLKGLMQHCWSVFMRLRKTDIYCCRMRTKQMWND